jgi:hypothetical protein
MAETIGHNGGASDDDYARFLNELQRQQQKIDTETGVMRAIYKRAEAAGCSVKALRAGKSAVRKDPEQVRIDLRDLIRVMSLRDFPVTQTDLFGEGGLEIKLSPDALAESQAWGAEEDGFREGRKGVPIDDNPCAPEDILFKHWAAGWHRAQVSLARELGANAKAADASRAKPGRKARSQTGDPLLLDAPREPKRRGRPPGSRNKVKDANGADTATIN